MFNWISHTDLYTSLTRQFDKYAVRTTDQPWPDYLVQEPQQRRTGPAWKDRIIRAPGQI